MAGSTKFPGLPPFACGSGLARTNRLSKSNIYVDSPCHDSDQSCGGNYNLNFQPFLDFVRRDKVDYGEVEDHE
jgi:hypothetical protein